jgi:hypothetical protein
VKLIHLTGLRFGHLVVHNRVADDGTKEAVWFCHCDCGKSYHARGGDLRTGRTVSCGCADGAPGPQTHERSDTVEVDVDREIVVRLRPEAAKRDLPVARLICDLLGVIATDNLTLAILDDDAEV